jgi:hypothetical protein
MDLAWALGLLLAAGLLLGTVMRVTRPPRCRTCGVTATHVEEYEVSQNPRVLAVAYRRPRCGELVARRPIGVPDA